DFLLRRHSKCALQQGPHLATNTWVKAMAMALWLSLGTSASAQTRLAPTSLKDLLWLEIPRDQKAVAWAKQQTQDSIERLKSLAVYKQVKQELDQTLKQPPLQPGIKLLQNRALRLL